jgi:hypothetical protein
MYVRNLSATYDEHNRLKQYRFSDSGSCYRIEYDATGRPWKRVDISDNASYYYHTGSGLVQELDGSFDVTTDYMAKARRYMLGEADADKYRYYVRDHQGSVMMMSDTEQNIERFTYVLKYNIMQYFHKVDTL